MNKVNILLTLAVTLLLSDNMNAQDFVKYSPSSAYVSMTYHYSNGVMTGISYFTYIKKDKGGLGAVTVSATKSGYYSDTVSTGEILKVTLGYNTSFWPTADPNNYTEIQLDLLSSGRIQNFVYRVSPTIATSSPPGVPSWRKFIFDTCTSITINRLQPTSVEKPDVQTLPKSFSLFQNYPNPFNPTTTISFSLPSKSFVSLKVFDVLGREVSMLLEEELPAGTYTRQWNAAASPGGVYFYRLQARQVDGGQARQINGGQAGAFTGTRRLVLLR